MKTTHFPKKSTIFRPIKSFPILRQSSPTPAFAESSRRQGEIEREREREREMVWLPGKQQGLEKI
jgi:hypothetical protein